MVYRLRISLAALVAFALILTGSVAMQMRASPGPVGPSGQMVICTGQGPVMVQVGADGQPTGAVHICPDCMVHALSSVLPQSLPVVRAVSVSMVHIESPDSLVGTHARTTPQARAPPLA